MIFTVDLKPLSVNKVWQGRRFKTKAYKDYERDLLWILPKMEPIKGRVEIRYRFHMKNHKQSDWDNPIKPLQDVLEKAGIIEADENIYCGMGQKVPGSKDFFEVMIIPYVERNIFEQ